MKGKGKVLSLFAFAFVALFFISMFSFVQAGVGIVQTQSSKLVPENSNVCLTYGIYNPWSQNSYVQIELSKSLEPIAKSYSSEIKMIPKNTSHENAIPVEFCFRTPKVYNESCLLFNTFLCKQTCGVPMKIYSGEVDVKQVSASQLKSGGSGGSSTQMSVGAPLSVKVECIPHGRNYSIVFLLVGFIALLILVLKIRKRKKSEKGAPSKTQTKKDKK